MAQRAGQREEARKLYPPAILGITALVNGRQTFGARELGAVAATGANASACLF